MKPWFLLLLPCLLLLSGCTFAHSRQALWTAEYATPSEAATFVQEEDSGLLLLGLFQLSDADHYAVVLERMRRRHRCAKLHHAQLDYFTDHWLIVGFPIVRITAVCEPTAGPPSPVSR